ncbi:MAG: N-6 DNA methylase, partial [Flavisolibacter sp.]|nr:N-6 DNA methylase [Flavisolibacter sp.]
SDALIDELLFASVQEELRWNSFKDADGDTLYKLFTKEQGVLAFMQSYGEGGHTYSGFLKTPLLTTPTPRLLENTVAIVNAIETVDRKTKARAYEYLLNKLAISQNEQLYAPLHIIGLMIEMAAPTPEDVVCDPAAGTGRFLAACSAYLQGYYSDALSNEDMLDYSSRFIGMEDDPVLLRIAAMNMIIQGIKDPQLKEVNALSKDNASFADEVSLVITYPPVAGNIDKDVLDESLVRAIDSTKPSLFYLAFILKALKKGGRAAVLVPENILADDTAAHKQIRRQLVDDHKLEAIVTMPGSRLLSSGTGTVLLLFTKTTTGGTDHVWFYNLQSDGLSLNDKDMPLQEGSMPHELTWPDDYGDIPDLLREWQAFKTGIAFTSGRKNRNNRSFIIPVQEIRQHNYDLRISSYKTQEQEKAERPEGLILSQKDLPAANRQQYPDEVQEEQPVLSQASTAKKANYKSVLLTVLIIVLGAIAAYSLLSEKKNDPTPDELATTATTDFTMPADTARENSSVKSNEEKSNQVPETKTIQSTPVENRKLSSSTSPQVKANNGKPAASETLPSEDNNVQSAKATSSNKRPVMTGKSNRPNDSEKVQYKVRSKAYFYNEPDERTRRNAFIIHWNNSYATLTPLDEKNGFVYIVFTNHLGQTSRGWLRKKDLRPVNAAVGDDVR